MGRTAASSETLHATCVAIDGRGVLLTGPSGSGKSDLALRLIDRGARLVADDGVRVRAVAGQARATAPSTIAGRMEVRGLGIVACETVADVPLALHIELLTAPPRMPEDSLPISRIAGLPLPRLALAAFEASAPIKVERALLIYGLTLA